MADRAYGRPGTPGTRMTCGSSPPKGRGARFAVNLCGSGILSPCGRVHLQEHPTAGADSGRDEVRPSAARWWGGPELDASRRLTVTHQHERPARLAPTRKFRDFEGLHSGR